MKNNRTIAARLPNCLVIGPQRAGTTWIHCYLESHPDVVVPRGLKETFYFDRHYARGPGWYARHFRPAATPTGCVVEVAPSYFHRPELPTRVHDQLGPIPLVCTLRNPAERSFSLFLLLRSYGLTSHDFRTATRQRPDILETSHYRTHIQRWFKVFGRERMLFLFQETLAERPDEYARRICAHLEIPFHPIAPELSVAVNRPSEPHSGRLARFGLRASELIRGMGAYGVVNVAKRIGLKSLFYGTSGSNRLPRLSAEDRAWINEQLADEIDSLEDLLDADLSHWKTDRASLRAA